MKNIIGMIYPDGTKLEQEYDTANRLVRFKNKRGHEITYDYDAEGRLASLMPGNRSGEQVML